MNELDLNLLRVLVALGDEHSVSRVALRLGKSQPAVSAALGKLRAFFGDALLIRSGNSMQPTPRAVGLIEAARAVLSRVNTEILATPGFDPASTGQPFILALSDVGEVVFLPPILAKLRRLAPNAAVQSVSLPAKALAEALEEGSIDLAVGYFPDLKQSNFFRQTLFVDSFAGLLRVDHPVTAARLTLAQFLQLEHAVVRAESRTEEVIERFLARRRIQRKVVLTSPHFASTPMVIAQSDLIVTVPQPLARYFSSVSAHLRFVELPFRPPRIELKQYWHRRFHHDHRIRWLRHLIYALFHEVTHGQAAP
jgi:DNA-binding transcriptional LysR family regulator